MYCTLQIVGRVKWLERCALQPIPKLRVACNICKWNSLEGQATQGIFSPIFVHFRPSNFFFYNLLILKICNNRRQLKSERTCLFTICCTFFLKPFVYFASGKVLVTTGMPDSTSAKSEVIDLEDGSNICQDLDDYPIQVQGAFGGLLNQVDPLVCGGRVPNTNVCYVVNQPGQSSEMLEKRAYSASLTLNSTHLWITGGFNGIIRLQTSEFVSIGQPSVQGPDLPYAAEGYCLVGVNSSTALLCGGEKDWGGEILNECYYMDWEDHSWLQGPSMMTKRYHHSCGIFKSAAHQGRNVVLAAGGYNFDDYELDTVEILDPTTNTWNEGNIYLDFKWPCMLCHCVT
jgi:hypothetical protein